MKHAWLVVAVLLLGWTNLGCTADAERAAGRATQDMKEGKKGEAERLWPRGPKIEDLKTELGLTDDQIAKMKEALAPLQKKNDELESNAEVKEAEAAVTKAKAALKAAEEKNKAARDNFDLLAERKKAVFNLVPEDKKAKAEGLLHYTPAKEKAAKEPKKEKKADAGR